MNGGKVVFPEQSTMKIDSKKVASNVHPASRTGQSRGRPARLTVFILAVSVMLVACQPKQVPVEAPPPGPPPAPAEAAVAIKATVEQYRQAYEVRSLEALEPQARTLTYRILETALPLQDYTSTMVVTPWK